MKKIFIFGTKRFYLVSFAIALILFTTMLLNSTSPEENLIGSWKEIAWEYEKVEKESENGNQISKTISKQIKKEIVKNLIIHQAEVWTFSPNGELILKGEHMVSKPLDWNLKGRGHVLSLIHPDLKTEKYNLNVLSKDEMILYFDSDIHARGIVKMTFKKIEG
tara:strand:- start:24601 stop:25089 length:489 start_codon:yes stop_codon:yes gene_type:complete